MKLLILSHNSLSNHANNGKTLNSFFHHRSSNEISQLYFQDEIPESNKFNSFYRLRDIDVAKSIFNYKTKPGSKIEPKAYILDHRYDRRPISKNTISLLKKFNSTKKIIRELIYNKYFGCLEGVYEWVNNIKPNAIFLMGSEYPFLYKLGTKLASKYNIPLYIYITDDYILNYKRKGLIENLLNNKLKQEIKKSVLASKECFAIGSDMAEAYSKVFSKKFDTLCNSIVFSKHPTPKKYERKYELFIIYAGGLTLGRGDMLCEFMSFANLSSQAANIKLHLSIYSHDLVDQKISKKFQDLNIKYYGKLNQPELSKKLIQADFLLHVESDAPENIAKTKLSISTKIPEYLATGVCVIAYGPGELSSIQLFKKNKIGLSIDSRTPKQEKIGNLSEAFTNPDLCSKFSKNGCDFVYQNFNSENTARKINKIIFSENI